MDTQVPSVIEHDITWNNGGMTYKAVRISVRNTASGASSKLVDMLVDDVTMFNVSKAGNGYFAGTLQVVGASTFAAGAFTGALSSGTSMSVTGANGQVLAVKQLTELLTIAAAATSTTTIQLPAGAIILAVSARVTAAVTCTSTFTVGDGGSAARYSTAAVSKAVNSTDPGTKAGAYYNASATEVVVTPDTVPSDATGRVRVTIYYIEVTPPTS